MDPGVFDFAGRCADVLRAARIAGADSLLVVDLVNVRYLSGFTGSNAALVLTPGGGAVLVTDGRYRDQARAECPAATVVIDRAVTTAGLRLALRNSGDDGGHGDTGDAGDAAGDMGAGGGGDSGGARRVGFESEHVSVAQWRAWLREVPEQQLIATTGLVEERRRRKDPAELALVQKACEVAESALVAMLPGIAVGMSEVEIARQLESDMLERGAQDRAFETIVASGPNSAIPHHQPAGRSLRPGDLLKIDFGARLGGYHSDITRCFVVAADPSPQQRGWHSAVASAAAGARAALRAGIPASHPYEVAVEDLARSGMASRFSHGLGHGVGLQIHEAPLLGAGSTGTLLAGDVVTVEPGVYFPGSGGVRIEDTLVVTDSGSHSLTTLPRELTRVGEPA